MDKWERMATEGIDAQEYHRRRRALTESESQATLFSRTMAVLGGMLGVSYLGTLATWNMQPTTGSFILLAIAFLVSGIVATTWGSATAKSGDPSAIVGAAFFAGITGAFLGPTLAMYTETLGSAIVSYSIVLTGGITAIAGAISTVVSFNYRKVESYLLMALWGLIGYLIVTLFTGVPEGLDYGVSFLGAGLFSVFLLVDFMRLRDEGRNMSSWGGAVVMASMIFLDMANLLLWILRIFGAAAGSDD